MTIEQRIEQLERQVNSLQASFIQSQKNQVPITAKTDNTATQVQTITPYTASRVAYIGDTESEFSLVRQGNISAWLVMEDNVQIPCGFEVAGDKIKVMWTEPLNKMATVNISIQ